MLLGLESPAGAFDVGTTAFRSALNVPFSTGLTLEGETVNTFPIWFIAPDAMGVNAEKSFRAEFASLFVERDGDDSKHQQKNKRNMRQEQRKEQNGMVISTSVTTGQENGNVGRRKQAN